MTENPTRLRDLFAARSPADRKELLERHHAELEQRIQRIERSKAMIEHALTCDEHDFTQCPNFRRLVDTIAEGGHLRPADPAWLDRHQSGPTLRRQADGDLGPA